MHDQGPSSEDLDRFSEGEAYCPDCGEAVFDDIEICPSCRAMVGGRVGRHPPRSRQLQRIEQRLNVVLVSLVVGGLLIACGVGAFLIWIFG